MNLLLLALFWACWAKLLADGLRHRALRSPSRTVVPTGRVPVGAKWAFVGVTGVLLVFATIGVLS